MSEGTVYVDAKFKDETGNVLVMGRVLLGHNAIINPRDLQLSTVKVIAFTSWDTLADSIIPGSMGSMTGKDYTRANPRYISVLAGSIGSLDRRGIGTQVGAGSGNYIRVRAYRLWEAGSAATARAYIGTHPGSVRASYWAVGV